MKRALGAVAAGHRATADTAVEILRAGGNAFDAAVAAFFTACVAEPVLTSLGGGGFLLAQDGAGRSRLYDFFTHTPLRKRPRRELQFYPVLADFGPVQQEFHIGLGALATPGAVKGMFAVQRELGRMPMRALVEPAAALARRGIRVNAFQAYTFEVVAPILAASAEGRALYRSRREPDRNLQPGERFRMPGFADTLEALAREGDALFYRGAIADRIVAACRAHGGSLRREDLQRYRVIRRRPLAFRHGDAALRTNPPPSTGGVLIALSLALWDGAFPGRAFRGTPQDYVDLAHAMQVTNVARARCQVDRLASGADARALLARGHLKRYAAALRRHAAATRGTTHISVADRRGNLAGLSVSNGEGCGYLIPGTGIMLNNMLGEEDINRHGFHRWPPDRRLASMMAPALVQRGDTSAVLGSGGSNRIRTAILQVLLQMIDRGLDPGRAVRHARIHFENARLDIEGGHRSGVREALRAAFEEIKVWENKNLFFGGVHVVRALRGGRAFDGAGDPRRGGVFRIA